MVTIPMKISVVYGIGKSQRKKGGVARPGLHAGALFRDAALGLIGHQEDLAG